MCFLCEMLPKPGTHERNSHPRSSSALRTGSGGGASASTPCIKSTTWAESVTQHSSSLRCNTLGDTTTEHDTHLTPTAILRPTAMLRLETCGGLCSLCDGLSLL